MDSHPLPGAAGERRLRRHVRRLGAPAPTEDADPVTEADLAGLPEPAQRFLRVAEVVGRPRDRSFVVRSDARFRLRPGQRFQPCWAWQYNTATPISRVFSMRLDLARVVPMVGVDSWIAGRGRLHGTLLGLIPVAEGTGREFDIGELVTWLDDACLLAPSMLLVPAVTWTAVDDRSFDVTVSESGVAATARVTLDQDDRLVQVSTTDRWVTLRSGLMRARWTTPVDGWTRHGHRWIPTGGRAIWHLPDGPYEYARGRFVPGTLRFDVDLTATGRKRRTSGQRLGQHEGR